MEFESEGEYRRPTAEERIKELQLVADITNKEVIHESLSGEFILISPSSKMVAEYDPKIAELVLSRQIESLIIDSNTKH